LAGSPAAEGGGEPGPDAHRRPGAPTLVAAAVGLTALAIYRTTLLPGLGAWDTAEAQTVLPLLGTMHPTGFPAFVLLGWVESIVLRPLGRPAFLANLLSAILTALAASGTVLVVRRLHVPLPVAAAAGIGLALTPIAWHISTAADAHALHLALLVAVVLALLRWEGLVAARGAATGDGASVARGDRALVLSAAIYGVAIANHALALLLAPGIGLFVLAVDPGALRRPRLVAAAGGAMLGVAALLYLELPLRAGPWPAPIVYGHPETWSGFWDIVLARQFAGSVSGPLDDPGGRAAALVSFAVDQLGALAVLVPVGLVVTAVRRPRYALLSGTAAVITVLFAASYANADIGRYYLGPAFFAWTWIAVLAGAVVELVVAAGRARDAGSGSGSGATAARAPVEGPGGPPRGWRRIPWRAIAASLAAVLVLGPTAAALGARWHANDRSAETWAAAWVDDAFGAMAPGAVVVSWWSYSTPMWYAQLVDGRRPDIEVIDDRTLIDENLGSAADAIDRFLGSRPVYVIRAQESDLQTLEQRYAIEPVGRPSNLYLVTGRLETTP
jgi:hypothetical protein